MSRQTQPTEQDAHEQSIREASEALIAAHRRASQAGSIPADQQDVIDARKRFYDLLGQRSAEANAAITERIERAIRNSPGATK